MRLAVCDDLIEESQQLSKKIISNLPESEVMIFNEIESLFEEIKKGLKFDVIFMKIKWSNKDKNGIDYATRIYHLAPATKVVFYTALGEEYIEQVFMRQTNIAGFLNHPINDSSLKGILEKIYLQLSEETDKLHIKQRGKYEKVSFEDILCIESRGHNIAVYTKDKVLDMYDSLSNLEQKLPSDFIKCHKSYIVNMKFVQKFDRNGIRIAGCDVEIPVSKLKYKTISEIFFDYIGEM